MTCSTCGHANPERAQFCLECGTPLGVRCGSCGTELPAAAKFCLECGAPLQVSGGGPQVAGPDTRHPAPETPSGARKVVTIVFGDLVGSTALHERLDAEAVRQFMERYYAAMRGAVEAHGGRVTQVMGDGVKAVFGAPRVAEDDALRAVRAAVAMQRAFAALAEQQRGRVGKTGLRVAVNTGEVVADEGQEIIGDPVNVAARLQEQGKDGDVVIGGATQRLVARLVTLDRLGSFALKGRMEAVEAYRVMSLEPPAGATTAAFVGRDAELARISAVYAAAIATPRAHLAVLLGSPGLGKSRLIDEITQRLGHAATVLTAHCDATGGATFAPVAEALRDWLRARRTDPTDPPDPSDPPDDLHAALDAALPPDHADRARLIAGIEALLAGSPAAPEETFFVVRRFLAALATAKPVVLVIDDLHWAEPLLLDLVEHLIQWGSGVPLLVLVGARPELRDTRSALVTTGGFVSDVITLGGLDAGAATRLAANVLGAADLPTAVAAKVLATSEGNPLFVAELVRMLVQEGVLKKEGDRWTAGAGLATLEMPPTIHALLAARIERLRPEERAVLECAAVVGRHFSRSAVAALLKRNGSELDARLQALRRTELIERDTGWFLGEPVLRFHHVLIRDAAYRRLLKGTRAELHTRLADWIEAQVADAAEYDETIGWHLEQAHQLLGELGPLDDAGRVLGERASQRLAAAGRRALARDDTPLAAALLGRAVDRLHADDPARAELALDWCEALLSAADVGPAANAIAELGRFASAGANDRQAARLQAWHTCFSGQLTALTAPQNLQATADAVAAAAAALARLGDAAGEAKAHSVHAQALARLGKVGACEAALDKALAAARKAGDRRRANAVLAGAPLAALWGPSPVTRASGRCLDVVRVLRITQGAPAVEAVALSCQGILEALRGRTDAARRMIASSRKMVEDLGIAHRLFEADVFAGRIDLLEGDADAAARNLRSAYDGLRELGLGIDAARAAALLARALLAQGKAAEAEVLSHESETLAGDDQQAAIAWRGVRAEALARRGETKTAVELAQAAVAIAAATDALLDHADARLALAVALRAAGRAGEADAENRRASELWEAKGATLLAARVRLPEKKRTESTPTETRAEATRSVQRRVRGNAATASAARFDVAFAAGDIGAIEACFSAADMRVIDHPTESTYGRAGAVDSYRRLLRLKDPVVRHEPLATLGESLGLFRRCIWADGTFGGRFNVGDYQREEFVVSEPDVLVEIFAADRLGDAIARMYQRYAEQLPEGPAGERAAKTARTAAAMLTRWAEDRLEDVFAPELEAVDHRTVGIGPARGPDLLSRWFAATDELMQDQIFRVEDVLALSADGLLRRTTQSGKVRASGGAFETSSWALSVFGPDGLQTRFELFDLGHEAEALARFDELAAFGSLPSGKGGQEGARNELLATLGDRFWLVRRWMGASAAGRTQFDVGAYEKEEIGVNEIDDQGLALRNEIFAGDRLGDAIPRLYQRYAASLPAGAARLRAAAIARTLSHMVAPPDLERYAAALAPTVEFVDHRTVGFAAGRGAQKLLRGFRSLFDLATDLATRVDDVLALDTNGILLRWTISGTDRASGGRFESIFLLLWRFGPDGLVVRDETFDAERAAEALARFDELTAAPADEKEALARFDALAGIVTPRAVATNEATAIAARLEAAFAAADSGTLDALWSDALTVIDHPTGASYGREGHVASLHRLRHAREPRLHVAPLASLGQRLALCRRMVASSGTSAGRFDVGAWDRDEIVLFESDGQARCRHIEIFTINHLGDAVARLYARYAEGLPDSPLRERAAATAYSVAMMLTQSADFPVTTFAPSLELVDHRSVGYGEFRGAEAVAHVEGVRREVAESFTIRVDAVLAVSADALVRKTTTSGTWREGGGTFERSMCALSVFGADGLVVRHEIFDPDREAEALARFETLRAASRA